MKQQVIAVVVVVAVAAAAAAVISGIVYSVLLCAFRYALVTHPKKGFKLFGLHPSSSCPK